jgi:hypothetical protein
MFSADYPGGKYPRAFSRESCARVDREQILAKREFNRATRDRPFIREQLRAYTLRVLLAFAQEAREHCPAWTAHKADEYCREFLRRLTIEAMRGRDDHIISNTDGSITAEWQRFLEQFDPWQEYEEVLLGIAARQAAGSTAANAAPPVEISAAEKRGPGRPRNPETDQIVMEWHAKGEPDVPTFVEQRYPQATGEERQGRIDQVRGAIRREKERREERT